MSKRANLAVVRLLSFAAAAFALTPRPASAWWETQVTTNQISSQSYVTNGLVAMWDGIENAGRGVHDPTSTVWADLSGNGHNFTVTSDAFNSDSLVINGTANVASLASTIQTGSTAFSLESVSRKSDSGDWRIFIASINNINLQIGYSTTSGYKPYYVGCGSSTYNTGISGVGTDMIQTMSYVWNGSTHSAYCDAVESSFSIGSATARSAIWNIPDVGYASGFVGNYYNVRLYNRVLTPDEIAYNQKIDNWRFVSGHGNDPQPIINYVYHANPPQTAYDAASPWNAAERTRLALDSAPVTNWVETLYGSNAVIRESFRPSAQIKQD